MSGQKDCEELQEGASTSSKMGQPALLPTSQAGKPINACPCAGHSRRTSCCWPHGGAFEALHGVWRHKFCPSESTQPTRTACRVLALLAMRERLCGAFEAPLPDRLNLHFNGRPRSCARFVLHMCRSASQLHPTELPQHGMLRTRPCRGAWRWLGQGSAVSENECL